jgi:hypothetical protein
MHCEINFPSTKQISDLDVPLPEGMEDDAYLQTLAQYLPDLLSEFQPDLVLYDAGVDPHAGDRLGKLALTDTGLYRREMQVFDYLCRRRLSGCQRDRWRLCRRLRCPHLPPLPTASRGESGLPSVSTLMPN